MFFKCCCCHCVLDCFIIKPKRHKKNKVSKVEWDIVETQTYIVKVPYFKKDKDYNYIKKKNKKSRRP